MTIKLFCNICGKEIEAHGLGFECKQATKMGFYIEFSHHIDPTRLLTETLVCDGCKRELRKAFGQAIEVLNSKIKSLKVKQLQLVDCEENFDWTPKQLMDFASSRCITLMNADALVEFSSTNLYSFSRWMNGRFDCTVDCKDHQFKSKVSDTSDDCENLEQ